VRVYVGVTDGDWYRFLAARGGSEANFWQPSGGRRFGAVPPGSPFLFKTHYKDGNRIVGGGFLSGWAPLRASRAWEFFGQDNGCASLAEMQARIRHYRREGNATPDPEIGCIMLRDVAFFPPDQQVQAPPDWSGNIVQGKSYDLTGTAGSYIEQVMTALFSRRVTDLLEAGGPGEVVGPVFGDPALRPVRIGQNAFKALVQEAYSRRCAVTGDKIVPVLQAAHIRPVTAEGLNRVDNGLLLRSDVHTLFDAGYLGVHPQKRTLLVSSRLRQEYGNGEEFYTRAASEQPIDQPARRADRPNREFLQWHADEVFLAS
jgi:putative restriction endonuclease